MTATPFVDAQGTAGAAGFTRTPEHDLAPLRWTADGWSAEGHALDPAALRPLRGLDLAWPGHQVPLDDVLRLAHAGVPLTSAHVPGWVPEELAALLTDRAWLAVRPDGSARCLADLRREEHSVRLRRLAPRPAEPPTVSVVMSSKRPHLLGFALRQIARQRHVRVEVLLGLHGIEGHEAVGKALADFPLPITVVSASPSVPFGELLDRAAARAGGEFIAKWDDDDWYGPEHLADLLLAKRYSGADIVGTAAEFFYLEPLTTMIRRTSYRSEVWTDFVAGGTILLDRSRFPGFEPLSRGVDAALLKSQQAQGARIYRTHGLGYVLRRSVAGSHTWQLPLAHFLRVQTNQWRGFRPSLLLETA